MDWTVWGLNPGGGDMKICKRMEVYLHAFLTSAYIEVSGQLHTPVPTEQEATWSPEQVRTLWRRGTYLAPYALLLKPYAYRLTVMMEPQASHMQTDGRDGTTSLTYAD
jgi:hypothetical protein